MRTEHKAHPRKSDLSVLNLERRMIYDYKSWNDRATFVLDNQDMDGFFIVKVYK